MTFSSFSLRCSIPDIDFPLSLFLMYYYFIVETIYMGLAEIIVKYYYIVLSYATHDATHTPHMHSLSSTSNILDPNLNPIELYGYGYGLEGEREEIESLDQIQN